MFTLAGVLPGCKITCAVECVTGFFPLVAFGAADGGFGHLFVTADAILMHGPFQPRFIEMIHIGIAVLFP